MGMQTPQEQPLQDEPSKSRGASVFLIALPAIMFYFLRFRNILNLPYWDDYEILLFLVHLRDHHGLAAKLLYALTAQHNEYKLMLGHAVFALQYWLLHHVSFAGLSVIGDSIILLLAIVLWKMFLPAQKDLSIRLALFVPVSWLLFQLSYGETLNWPEPAIQNLGIMVFSLASFAFLARAEGYSFFCSLLCLVLAISASANGFAVVVVGCLMLIRQRRLRATLVWLGVSLGMIALYAFRYRRTGSESVGQHINLPKLIAIKFAYTISFLGSIGEIVHAIHIPTLAGSITLGVLTCSFFLYATVKHRLSTNPAVNFSVLFVFITSVGVALLRSEIGILQSTSSRYRIYSSLLLMFAWFILSERYLQIPSRLLWRNPLYLASCVSVVLLAVVLDIEGLHFMHRRSALMIREMAAYEHPSADPGFGPVSQGETDPSINAAFNGLARELLSKCASYGIYQPPRY